MAEQIAVIIGAGPAGLTAAYELLTTTTIKPIILEADGVVGGLARTVNYKQNLIDIGGHRFFSKSDRIMDWWLHILPLEPGQEDAFTIAYQGQQRTIDTAQANGQPPDGDRVMLVRRRKSRIYFVRKFFDYPVTLNWNTIRNLGARRIARIVVSYARARLFPLPEVNLEEFYINRFGKVLYETFFKRYTEKVWGVPCTAISAEWGAQRVKGLSLTKTVAHMLGHIARRRVQSVRQKAVETSLIERFLYPKYGPGQLWAEVARQIEAMGGEIRYHTRVTKLYTEHFRVTAVCAVRADGACERIAGDYFFSTMPIKHLFEGLDADIPTSVREIAAGLVYRDFITVGLLVTQVRSDEHEAGGSTDNWIYIQEPDVKLGRVQIFNNWSPFMVADSDTVWLGLEYFCNEGDALWRLNDEDMAAFATDELAQIGLIARADVRDHVVIRTTKAYPAYYGTYDRFDALVAYINQYTNLFLIGRNGMHRYNNQDHSMLTAITAVENIRAGRCDKANIWDVNTEQEYHESRTARVNR